MSTYKNTNKTYKNLYKPSFFVHKGELDVEKPKKSQNYSRITLELLQNYTSDYRKLWCFSVYSWVFLCFSVFL